MRTWEVSVIGYAAASPGTSAAGARRAVCFDTTGTPRQDGLLVGCCERAASVFPHLQDQDFALCLEAARHGGLLWVDPRDRELWWVSESAASLCMHSSLATHHVPNTTGKPLVDLGDPELAALLDGALAA